MDTGKVIKELSKKYPGKKIIKLPEDNPTEIICEIEPGFAVAVIDKSEPHFHKKTTEIYEIMEGNLTVYIDNKEYELKEGGRLTIEPGKIHYAEGYETWVKVYSEPPWTTEDHIFSNG